MTPCPCIQTPAFPVVTGRSLFSVMMEGDQQQRNFSKNEPFLKKMGSARLFGNPSHKTRLNVPEFIAKLYTLLSTPENESFISWTESGESFRIRDVSEFSKHVLPRNFKHANFSSFVRQLNKYDFHKIKSPSTSRSEDSGASAGGNAGFWEFRHPRFRRGEPERLSLIRRKRTLGEGSSQRFIDSVTDAENSATDESTSVLSDRLSSLTGQCSELSRTVSQLMVHFQKVLEECSTVKQYVHNQNRIVRQLLAAGGERVTGPTSRASPLPPYFSTLPPIKKASPTAVVAGAGSELQLMDEASEFIQKISWRYAPTVLVVDDDAICRRLSHKFLSLLGCKSDSSTDGLDALQKLRSKQYDLVLMDIVMPNMEGLSATRQIREFNHETPVISMTSSCSIDDQKLYTFTGMNGILPKPFSIEFLKSLLREHCHHLFTPPVEAAVAALV